MVLAETVLFRRGRGKLITIASQWGAHTYQAFALLQSINVLWQRANVGNISLTNSLAWVVNLPSVTSHWMLLKFIPCHWIKPFQNRLSLTLAWAGSSCLLKSVWGEWKGISVFAFPRDRYKWLRECVYLLWFNCALGTIWHFPLFHTLWL